MADLASTDPTGLFHAVSDPTRLRLLRLLQREELNVQELVGILEMNQPRVSKHLAVLRDAGWIRQRREATWSWYRATAADGFAGGAQLHAAVTAVLGGLPEAPDDDERLALALAARADRGRDAVASVADDWDRIRRQYDHPDLQTGVLAALVPPGLRVADVGTGTGALLPALAAVAEEVVAVDHSAAMLQRARRLCRDAGHDNVNFRQADAQALPFRDAVFDAVTCSMVLHHVARPPQAVAELVRITRPGGRIVLIDFTRHNLTWLREEMAHRWLGFDRDEVGRLLQGAGLELRRFLVRKRTARDDEETAADAGRGPFAWPEVFLAEAVRS